MAFKVVTAKEWEAMGLPTEISTINFGNTEFPKKLKEQKKKKDKEKNNLKKNNKNIVSNLIDEELHRMYRVEDQD